MTGKIHSESEAAHLFSKKKGHKVRYVPEQGQWIVKRGDLWEFDGAHRVESLVRKLLDDVRADSRWKGSMATVRNVRTLAERDSSLHASVNQIDAEPMLLGTQTGVVDVVEKRTITPGAIIFVTKRTSVDPDFQADCPQWSKFLSQICQGNEEEVAFIRRWCGYVLTGSIKEQVLLVLYGPGGNGKSVLVNTIASLMGSYHREAASETFVENKTVKHETAMAYIAGARFVTSGETDQGGGWNEATVKRATGGDWVTARFLYKNPFTYRPTYKIWIATNHLPKLKSFDRAMRRRVHLLELKFVPKKPDGDLEEKLKAEHPAILAWMLEGAREWQRSGLNPPSTVTAATSDYFEEQDTLGLWLKKATRKSKKHTTPTAALCDSYNRFLRSRNAPEVEPNVFGRLLSARGYDRVLGSSSTEPRARRFKIKLV